MNGSFRLETERLVLRPFVPEDLDALEPILADPVMMQYYPAPFSRERSSEWIDWNRGHYAERGFGLWAMDAKDTGELLGDCGLIPQVVDGNPEVEVGWHVRRSHWRRGLATEAGAACCRHAFEELGLARLISLIRPENVPSRGVAEKLGMSIERETDHGSFRHYVYVLDKPEA